MKSRFDIQQEITNTFIEAIENSLIEGKWNRPWVCNNNGFPTNVSSNKHYRGINVFLLMMEQMHKGYTTGIWGTFKQWNAKGAKVQKGEKSSTIIFWKPVEKFNDEGEQEKFMIARAFNVFNADQVEGYEIPTVDNGENISLVESAESFINNIGADIRFGGDRAFYNFREDFIMLPHVEQFKNTEGYYSTMMHELGHWTAHKSRLDRKFDGEDSYAMEELVAEFTSAFLDAEFGIMAEGRDDHFRYLQGWLRKLKENKKAIFTAASKAQAAVDFLHAQSSGEGADNTIAEAEAA